MSSTSIDEVVGQNQTVYDVYFSQADTTGSGAIGAIDAANFLKQSKLKDTSLKEVWELADPTGKGYLDRQAFYIALKLIALAQSNQEVKIENITLPAPAPKLGESSSNLTSLILPDDPWYIKASFRINYDKTFDSLSPINNKIGGNRVKPLLMSSGLPVDVLGKIWELSDLDQDGQLDRDEFLIAMQLISKSKEGATIPDQLPPSLLPFKVRHTSNSSTFMVPPPGVVTASYTVNLAIAETKPWVVSFEEKSKSDVTFVQIDGDKDGYVSGLEVRDIFLKTGLPQQTLANIWSLCDIGSTGKLNSEQFALAMHFVNKKLSTGLDPPVDLLPEMIPPSFRSKPIHSEDFQMNKELEELQTQVTELQREKLFYEQRASEHDLLTRQKRTELSNLELEVESLFKTLHERELNKSEEQKKLAECEDKLVKLDTQLVDLRQKFNYEREEIELLKTQMQQMESAMKCKDTDLGRVRLELQSVISEQANLEARLNSRKGNLNELNTHLNLVNFEMSKEKSKIDLLRVFQENLNKLMKEYDNLALTDENKLNNEIKQLESENAKLSQQIKAAIESNMNEQAGAMFNEQTFFSPPIKQVNNEASLDPFFSNQQNTNDVSVEDPFQTFDPFKEQNGHDPFSSDDPFKDATDTDPFKPKVEESQPDLFEQFDPFTNLAQSKKQLEMSVFDDPFGEKKKPAPPRPAPPRPQTPSLKPTKKSEISQRPQSALDFTRNTKLDLFNDFVDPFQSTNNSNTAKDPFGNNGFDWNAMSAKTVTNNGQKTNDTWDPFA